MPNLKLSGGDRPGHRFLAGLGRSTTTLRRGAHGVGRGDSGSNIGAVPEPSERSGGGRPGAVSSAPPGSFCVPQLRWRKSGRSFARGDRGDCAPREGRGLSWQSYRRRGLHHESTSSPTPYPSRGRPFPATAVHAARIRSDLAGEIDARRLSHDPEAARSECAIGRSRSRTLFSSLPAALAADGVRPPGHRQHWAGRDQSLSAVDVARRSVTNVC
jgi:hypothetical protein